MTFFEVTAALNKMNQEDPFVTRTGINGSMKAERAIDETYVHVSFSGNYTGGVRNIKVNSRGTVAMLDGSFDPSDNIDVGVEALWLSCNNAIMSGVGDAELGYYIPSAGYFPVVEVNHKKGDWGDGDGPYDYVDFVCTEEPLDIGEVVMARWESLVPQNLRESTEKINEGLEDDDPINEDVGRVDITFTYGDDEEDYDTGYIVQYADRYEVQSDLNIASGKTIEEMKANFEKEVRDNLDYAVEDVSFDWDIEEGLDESKKKVNEAVEGYIHSRLKAFVEYVPAVYYACYTLTAEGYEEDHFFDSDSFEDAISACKQKTNDSHLATHICVIIEDEQDDEAYEFMKSYGLSNCEVVAEFSPDPGEALTGEVGEWHGMSRADIQAFAEESSEAWNGDDSWVEGIVQWLLACNDEDIWGIVTSDNIDEDDDTYIKEAFMDSSYYM